MPEYSDEILDSNQISSTDKEGRPIPVTIPIALAPGITVVYTTRLGGLSAGDYGNLNLGGKSGDNPQAVMSNRIALSEAVHARLSLVSQVHSGVAVDVDDSFVVNTPFGFDVSGTHRSVEEYQTVVAWRPMPMVVSTSRPNPLGQLRMCRRSSRQTGKSPHNPASPWVCSRLTACRCSSLTRSPASSARLIADGVALNAASSNPPWN